MESETPQMSQEGQGETDQVSPEVPTPEVETEKKSAGPLFGIIIIVVLFVLAGFYFWSTQIKDSGSMTAEEIAAEVDPNLESLGSQSTSDEIENIEADLDATGLEGLDQELEDIDLELNF